MPDHQTSINELLSDDAILAEIGARLSRHRIDANLTQAELAAQAGLSKRTVERMEAGGSSQTISLIRVLRVLELLTGLESAVPAAGPGPMELLRHRGQPRRRASGRKAEPAGVAEPPDWRWGDADG